MTESEIRKEVEYTLNASRTAAQRAENSEKMAKAKK